MKFSGAYLALCLLIADFSAFAQNHVIDSLIKVVKTEKEDTNKVNTLNWLSDRLWRMGDTSKIYASQALVLATKLQYQKGISGAYSNFGQIYANQADFTKALDYDNRALEIHKNIGDKKNTAFNLGSMGTIYYEQGDYPKALKYGFDALTLYRQLGDKNGIATNDCNIGVAYDAQANYPKALEYYGKGDSIEQLLGNKNAVAGILGNIGTVYEEQLNHSKALECDLKALGILEEVGDQFGIALDLGNIGNIYGNQHNYAKCLEYLMKALEIYKKLGSKEGAAINLGNIGMVYTKLRNYAYSKLYLDSSLSLSKNIGMKDNIRATYSGFAVLDSATGNHKQELEDFKNFIIYRDSLNNEANTKKTVQAEMNFEFEQKQTAQKAEQDKKDAIAEQERNKQKVIRNSFIAGFALMLALAFFIFRGYRQKQKANVIISQQKEEVEKQKTLVEHQKALVEEKNKDILDSITYAKRLQDAILPPLSIINKYLPDSFVLYKPKDIVAGDFYWMEVAPLNPPIRGTSNTPVSSFPNGEGQDGAAILIAAADCTGHGVPGALVSVVCSNALNRTVKEFKITEPGKILDKVRELVLETFEKSESNVQDGMDISLVSITVPAPSQPSPLGKENDKVSPNGGDLEGATIQWSGAYNSLWYIQDGEMKEIAADKQPIGKTDNPKSFTTHTITLNPPSEGREAGALLYLFTDGFADQFGGPKGKKFKYQQLQEKLIAISHKPLAEQKEILEKKFEEWRGNLEQTDDVCIIGIRI